MSAPGGPGLGDCVPGPGGWGVSAPGGVPGRGGSLLMGGVPSQGCACSRVGGGVPGRGGSAPGVGGVGIPACTEADTPPPPVDRHTLVKILPWPNFVAAGNK